MLFLSLFHFDLIPPFFIWPAPQFCRLNMRVDPTQLLREIIKHNDSVAAWKRHRSRHHYSSRPRPQMSPELGTMLMNIATGLAMRPNFAGYSFKSDLIGDALLAMSRAVEKFDDSRDYSAFSYLNRCAWNAFLKCIAREGKHAHLTELCRDEMASRISIHDPTSLPGPPDSYDDDTTYEPLPPGSLAPLNQHVLV